MTFDELVEFIERKMNMSHIYQPFIIRTLVNAGGSATVSQLAEALLSEDENQLRYVEKRLQRMPLRVLRKHGVIESDGDLVCLNLEEKLDFESKERLRELCRGRLDRFAEARGRAVWDFRFLDADEVPDSVRHEVLKASGGRCALCGATSRERPLEIDHIKPRSMGGTDDIWNLQVLCDRCNRAKGNRDQIDFNEAADSDAMAGCAFCAPEIDDKIIETYGTVVAIEDANPVSMGHMLVIPRRHTEDFFSMTDRERSDAMYLLRMLKKKVSMQDGSVSGFNVGANSGSSAGQSVMHAHIHLIPRRDGDTPHPKGGIRGAVPARMSY